MKKNKYLIAGIILAVALIGASLSEVTGSKFPIGTTVLHDSLTTALTINKNVYISGDARVSGIRFREYNSYITEGLSNLTLTSPAYDFQTITANSIMLLDSASGLNLIYGNAQFDNYTKLGGSSAPAIKQVFVKGKLNATAGVTSSINHGISDYRHIISFVWNIMEDSTGLILSPGYNGSTGMTVGNIFYINSGAINYFCPANSGNIKGDTLNCLITFTQ